MKVFRTRDVSVKSKRLSSERLQRMSAMLIPLLNTLRCPGIKLDFLNDLEC